VGVKKGTCPTKVLHTSYGMSSKNQLILPVNGEDKSNWRFYAKVQIPPSTVTMVIRLNEKSVLGSLNTAFDPLVFPLDEPVEPDPVEPPAEVGTEDGVKTALGLATHELATAFAAETLEGAEGLTVPLPPKLQAEACLLLAS